MIINSLHIKHFRTIVRHKWYTGIECFKLRLYWQGLVHDLSKFSLCEFSESAKYYQGTRTPIDRAKEVKGHSLAWLHHKGKNKHHWHYWTDFRNGKVYSVGIPDKYLKEMACDIVGASKSYLGGKYDPSEPMKYLEKKINGWVMKESDKVRVRNILKEITKT